MNRLKFLHRLPYLFSSALLGTIASYFIYIHISRDMGFEEFSEVSYWMNLGAIFTVLYDLGINQYLQVNYASDIKRLSAFLLGLKLVLGFVVTIGLGLYVHQLPLFFFLTSFLWVSFQAYFSYYLRLQQKFFFDVVFNLAYYAIFVPAFLYLLKQQTWQASLLFAWFHFALRSTVLIVIFILLFSVFKQRIQMRQLFRDWERLKKIAGFSLLSILVVGMQNVDALILYHTIVSPALFSKLSMVIKIGFLNFAFFDSFITLVSATESKDGYKSARVLSRQFRLCLLFGLFISICIHVMALLLPFVVGDKWIGLSEMSAWAIINNIAVYPLLFFQFKLLSEGKVRAVAGALVALIISSSLISYYFVSYQWYFMLSALVRLAITAYYLSVYRRKMQAMPVIGLRFSKI